jgi:hypothetical protein
MLEQGTNRTKQRRNKMEDKIQTQDPIIKYQYELEVQFLAKFSDSAFFGWMN